MNRRMAGLAAALMLMTFAPIHTHAALRRVPEGMKTEQGGMDDQKQKRQGAGRGELAAGDAGQCQRCP